jgi:hypothetical protein
VVLTCLKLFRSDAAQRTAYFNVAAHQLRAYIESIGSTTPRILLQTYSNGGSHSAVQTAEAYKLLYGGDLPISAIVMDSTPGQPHWQETANALLQGMPKSFLAQTIGAISIHSTLAMTTIMHHTGIAELIRVEEFTDTVHVQHMSKDRARYWQIVTSTWDKAHK